MNLIGRFLIGLIVTAVLSLPIFVRAGCTPIAYEKDGTPIVVDHETIRLDSEDVTMRFRVDQYTVDGVYCFLNTGETVKQLLGFPAWKRDSGNFVPSIVKKFEAWIGDRTLVFTEKSDPPDSEGDYSPTVRQSAPYQQLRWMVTEVTFPGHAVTTLHVRYTTRPYYPREYIGRAGYGAVYDIGINRHWKGKVRKGSFTLDGSALGRAQGISRSYFPMKSMARSLGKYFVRYEIADYKPSGKITVSIPGAQGGTNRENE